VIDIITEPEENCEFRIANFEWVWGPEAREIANFEFRISNEVQIGNLLPQVRDAFGTLHTGKLRYGLRAPKPFEIRNSKFEIS